MTINFHKNELIQKTIVHYIETFDILTDTERFVPERVKNKILQYIQKSLFRALKQVDKEDKRFQRRLYWKHRKALKQSLNDDVDYYLAMYLTGKKIDRDNSLNDEIRTDGSEAENENVNSENTEVENESKTETLTEPKSSEEKNENENSDKSEDSGE